MFRNPEIRALFNQSHFGVSSMIVNARDKRCGHSQALAALRRTLAI